MELLELEGLPPPLDLDKFHASCLTEDQLGIMFDDISLRAASQPDDHESLTQLKSMIIEVRDSGFIDYAFQMAMTVGAMACVHAHMQNTAQELSETLAEPNAQAKHDHAHHGNEHSDDAEAKDCKDCTDKRRCSKHHKA